MSGCEGPVYDDHALWGCLSMSDQWSVHDSVDGGNIAPLRVPKTLLFWGCRIYWVVQDLLLAHSHFS